LGTDQVRDQGDDVAEPAQDDRVLTHSFMPFVASQSLKRTLSRGGSTAAVNLGTRDQTWTLSGRAGRVEMDADEVLWTQIGEGDLDEAFTVTECLVDLCQILGDADLDGGFAVVQRSSRSALTMGREEGERQVDRGG
ncbi:MAG TPA: hypothetical protein PLU19_17125, partial [Dermatophilaceae bacterium]|nr:hypothetical protein [Dermatophilaceae bacterium]